MTSFLSRLPAPTNKVRRVQLLLLMGTFAGAWAAIFGRIAQHHGMPTPVIISFRILLSAVVLTPVVWKYHRQEFFKLNKRDVLIAAGGGFWFGIHLMSGFEALKHTSVLVSSVLGGTLPIWVAILEVYVLKARLNRMVWIGLMITLCGGIIITLAGSGDASLGDNPLLGSGLALMAAVAGAVYAIVGRRSRDKMSYLPYLWLAFTFGGLTSLSLVVVTGQSMVGYDFSTYLAVILLTIVPQLIGHGVYNYALRQLPATFVSVVGQLGIIISAVLAYLFFREIPSVLEIPGSLAIIVGITMVNLNKPPIPKAQLGVQLTVELVSPAPSPMPVGGDSEPIQVI
ncbi:MAG: EamA family transporter [Anaerolineaceae bacterium]|nr:EamA family transporter [Anaerolineaceae bacterium]